jgi:hypothetical protein
VPSWQDKKGCYIDPFRPRVEPHGFASQGEALEAQVHHLASVRNLFEKLDVFIFTLGLTESWEHVSDGAALPLAPGVAGGEWDPRRYRFRNYAVDEIERDLIGFIDRLRSVNQSSRVILTVSPVPLAATYEPRHVLLSTSLSKARLRVAADSCSSKRPLVSYFPSYEIITGPHAGGRYFDSDLRSVTDAGVNHVMRVFFEHFAEPGPCPDKTPEPPDYIGSELATVKDIICDEEALTG